MSQSGAGISPDTSSTLEITNGCVRVALKRSHVVPYTCVTSIDGQLEETHTYQQQQQPLLSRHYALLEKRADSFLRPAHIDEDAVSVHPKSRQESPAHDLRSTYADDASKLNGNPMMPQWEDKTTPPTMEELVRRMTVDTPSIRMSSLAQSDAPYSRSSILRSSTDVHSLKRTDTGISFAGVARSMTKKIPTLKPTRTSAELHSSQMPKREAQGPEYPPSAGIGKKSRMLSFHLPSSLKARKQPELPAKPSPVIEEYPACLIPNNPLPGPPSRRVGLAARRQVKMDLTLSLPDLSKASGTDAMRSAILSSITPSRPRSPRTPRIREKEVTWSRDTGSIDDVETASIVEDVAFNPDTANEVTSADADDELEVGSALASFRLMNPSIEPTVDMIPLPAPTRLVTPPFERPRPRVRDRCYISQPSSFNNRSERLTSDSDLGSTPDIHLTPEGAGEAGLTEREARTQKELFHLAKKSKAARARRWPWNSPKTSGSEEQTKPKDEHGEEPKNASTNAFRRSHRFPEVREKNERGRKSPNHIITPWRREKSADKPPLPSASLANMLVPPTFVPPGCEKVQVPTPPTFDSAHEVRSKLGAFFFDLNGFSSVRRRSKPSPGGYWDSNAVLMSMRTDLDLTNDKDGEGPEGRPPPAPFHFGPVNDTPRLDATPGLYTAPDGYLKVKGVPTTPSQRSLKTPTQATQDSWFRMHYGEYAVDEETLTAAALKEADERRKFDWLVPEHLPNSPLCPLHPKYVGPSKGLCYWHGRKSNGWGVEPRRDYIADPMKIGQGKTRGWEVGKVEALKDQKQKRSLQFFDG